MNTRTRWAPNQVGGLAQEMDRETGQLGRYYVLVRVARPNGRFLPVDPETGGPDEARRYDLVRLYL